MGERCYCSPTIIDLLKSFGLHHAALMDDNYLHCKLTKKIYTTVKKREIFKIIFLN